MTVPCGSHVALSLREREAAPAVDRVQSGPKRAPLAEREGHTPPAPGYARSSRPSHVGDVLAQRGRQVDLVLLLLDQDLADVLGHGVLAQRLALADALAVVADRLVLVLEVEPEHLLGLLRRLHRLGRDRRHPAEVVDLLGDDQGVLQLLAGVLLQLLGDVHVLRPP